MSPASAPRVRMKEHSEVIAEIGVNHGGDPELACRMINAAAASGADAVKFQTFRADRLATERTPKVEYQNRTTEAGQSHREMLRALELSEDGHRQVFGHCRGVGIEFISTPYDPESVDLLEALGVERYKVASADLVDLFLLERLARTGKPILLSVGMATMGEVETALGVLEHHRCGPVTLLHCVSNYPCADESLNLSVIPTLRRAFGRDVGYSDHSRGPLAAAMAVALGATVIEKHFTLDRSADGPDHAASDTPEQFADLVHHVRRAETMLGVAVKRCQDEERQMARVSRKSLTLTRDVKTGERLTREHFRLMRPGTRLPAAVLDQVVGRTAGTDLDAGHQIDWGDVGPVVDSPGDRDGAAGSA